MYLQEFFLIFLSHHNPLEKYCEKTMVPHYNYEYNRKINCKLYRNKNYFLSYFSKKVSILTRLLVARKQLEPLSVYTDVVLDNATNTDDKKYLE